MLSVIIGAALSVVETIGVLFVGKTGLEVICNALVNLAKFLGLIKPETRPEELGDKALQSEYKPEDYKTYNEYVKAIEDFVLDPEKSKNTTIEEKLSKAIEIAVCLAMENTDLDFDSLDSAINKEVEYFKDNDGAKLRWLIEDLAKEPQSFNDVVRYISGKEKSSQGINNAITILKSIEKTLNPLLETPEIHKKVMDLRN